MTELLSKIIEPKIDGNNLIYEIPIEKLNGIYLRAFHPYSFQYIRIQIGEIVFTRQSLADLIRVYPRYSWLERPLGTFSAIELCVILGKYEKEGLMEMSKYINLANVYNQKVFIILEEVTGDKNMKISVDMIQ